HGLAARPHGLTAWTHVLATGPDGLAARAHRLAARLRDLAAGPAADLPGPLIAGLDEPTAVIDEALPGAARNESRPPQIGPGERGSRTGLDVARGVSDRRSTPLWVLPGSGPGASDMAPTAVIGRTTRARVLRGCAHRPVRARMVRARRAGATVSRCGSCRPSQGGPAACGTSGGPGWAGTTVVDGGPDRAPAPRADDRPPGPAAGSGAELRHPPGLDVDECVEDQLPRGPALRFRIEAGTDERHEVPRRPVEVELAHGDPPEHRLQRSGAVRV